MLLVILLCERSIDCDPNQMSAGETELTQAGGTVTGCEFTMGRPVFDGSCEGTAHKLLKESLQKQLGEIVHCSEKRRKSGQVSAMFGHPLIRRSETADVCSLNKPVWGLVERTRVVIAPLIIGLTQPTDRLGPRLAVEAARRLLLELAGAK